MSDTRLIKKNESEYSYRRKHQNAVCVLTATWVESVYRMRFPHDIVRNEEHVLEAVDWIRAKLPMEFSVS